MIGSDTESENETHGAGECSFASTEEWIEDNVSWKLEDFTDVSGVTVKCNNLQSISEITELIFLGQNKIHWPEALVSAKIPVNVNSNYLETVNVLLLSDPKEHF